MAVVQSPNSKASVPAPLDNNNNKKKNKMKEISSGTAENNAEMKTEMESDKPKPKKRNSNPGVRVIHGKIYDSKNGTTCHQCRQKTLFEYVSCKNKAKTKPCTLKYCVTCLLNRYGEKAEEVSLLDQWDCPRCKDVCNCSICMKKRGHQPTGMVSPMAKAGGFTSVSDMIHAKGAQNVCNYKRVKETCASPGKLITEGIMITSPKKSGKENLFDGKTDPNVEPSLPVPSPAKAKPIKKKRKGVEVTKDTRVSDKADPNADPSLPVPSPAKVKPIKKKQKGVEVMKGDTGVSDKPDPNADPSLPVPSLAKEKPIKKKRKGVEVMKGDTGVSDKPDPNADPSLPVPSLAKEKPIKKKRKGVEVMKDDTGVSDKADPNADPSLPVPSLAKEKPIKKKRKGVEVMKGDTGVSDKPDPNADPSLPVPSLAKEKPIKKKRKGVEVMKDGTGVSDKADPNADPSLPVPSLAKEKPIKKKRKGVEVMKDDTGVSDKADPNVDPLLPVPSLAKEKPIKKKQKAVEITKDDTGVSDKALNEKKPKKLKSKASKETIVVNVNNGELSKENTTNHDQNATQHLKDNKSKKVKKNDLDSLESVIPLPTGSDLVTIAGVDLSKEDAGNALQLLEFCSTFGKILDVKKGQAEAILRDLFKGPSSRTRSGKCTSVIQFYIQLLSVLQEESDSESESESSQLHLAKGNGSWLKVLKNCISKSRLKHLDSIDTTAAGYDNLDSSTKLGLLIFLCDEVLGTEKIRNWIDNENTKFAEKKKEAKEKLCAAKNKEKILKQKMLDEIAKTIIANHGVPITTKEHDSVVSKIKKKAAEAHAEMLECQKMGPEDKQKPDAVRIVPIFKDNKGHIYWRLKGCSDNPGILLQDIGTGDHMVGAADKWFGFDDEQIKLIEGQFKILRLRFKKYYKN
nr:zinc-finger domain of monoamine-oxidase A repressor R1 [Tanacetum cinerariifolium]